MILTMVLMLPSCILLFIYSKNNNNNTNNKNKNNKSIEIEIILWTISSTSLSFFLGSYQVHEKSILLSVSIISLLFLYDTKFVCNFFIILSTWTLYPLIKIDELCIGYWCIMIIFICLIWIYNLLHDEEEEEEDNNNAKKGLLMIQWLTYNIIIPISWICMILLHIIEIIFKNNVPYHLPDLFSVLWSIIGCIFFCWSWLYCTWNVYFLYCWSSWSYDVVVEEEERKKKIE